MRIRQHLFCCNLTLSHWSCFRGLRPEDECLQDDRRLSVNSHDAKSLFWSSCSFGLGCKRQVVNKEELVLVVVSYPSLNLGECKTLKNLFYSAVTGLGFGSNSPLLFSICYCLLVVTWGGWVLMGFNGFLMGFKDTSWQNMWQHILSSLNTRMKEFLSQHKNGSCTRC